MIADMMEMQAYLAQVQSQRGESVRCELTPSFSARVNDAAITQALITALPMAQGLKLRIIRSRGRGVILTAGVHYREGVRMLAGERLSPTEAAALEQAQRIVSDFLPMGKEERFGGIYDWVCRNIIYDHTAPGQTGYERLVGAAGALLNGKANCQGFADLLYLLCGLCGVECEYRCGRGARRLHMWNAVRLDGVWREVDASKGARGILA